MTYLKTMVLFNISKVKKVKPAMDMWSFLVSTMNNCICFVICVPGSIIKIDLKAVLMFEAKKIPLCTVSDTCSGQLIGSYNGSMQPAVNNPAVHRWNIDSLPIQKLQKCAWQHTEKAGKKWKKRKQEKKSPLQ